jgi:hypothetical protein
MVVNTQSAFTLKKRRLSEAITTYDANTYSRTISRSTWRGQAYLLDMLTTAVMHGTAASLTNDDL